MGSVGLALATAFPGCARTPNYFLAVTLTATGTGECSAFLWGRPSATAPWSPLGVGDGQLNAGELITGSTSKTFRTVVQFIGAFERVYLQVADLAGTDAAVSASLTEIVEI